MDLDKNGYVTDTELDDLLKVLWTELKPFDLIPIIKMFLAVGSTILVDYKKFKEYVMIAVQQANQQVERKEKAKQL
jgi:hypothetical protein